MSVLTERRRVRAHLAGALRAVRAVGPAHLTAAQRSRRRAALGALARYIALGRYPLNRVSPRPTPVFIDDDGARCAMAALLESSGHAPLAARIARDHNLARIDDLRDDPGLAAWLDAHGLTLAEAARIQPSYSEHREYTWQPTVSVVATVLAGAGPDTGARVTLSPGARVGVRRVVGGTRDNGASIFGSLALTVEYARSFVVGVGGAHHLGLVLQWEPESNGRDFQWYLLGGPIAALDDDDTPGTAFGAQFGAGFSFRRRSVPLFAEVVAQGLGQSSGATLRAGVNLGVVW